MHAGKSYRKTATQSGELSVLKVWVEAKNNDVTLGNQSWGPGDSTQAWLLNSREFAGPRGRLAASSVGCFLEELIYRNWPGSGVKGQVLGVRSLGSGKCVR